MQRNKIINSYLTSLDTAITADADETLGSVLPLIQSSHSPVFVFSKENIFTGLVSPHQVLYERKYPYTTKLSSIAAMPPYMTRDTPLYVVASRMLENRVYVLPLFDEKKQIVGVVHAEDVFKKLITDLDFLKFISSAVKPKTPVTAEVTATVGDIFQIMKDKQVSRVILVNDKGVLSGIISRKDLLSAFVKPAEKQRFGKNGMQQTDRAFDEEKKYRKDNPIKNYLTELVYTLPYKTEQSELIKQLIASEHNSVVLINAQKKPVGFVSMRDILVGLASLRPENTIHLSITKPTSNVSDNDLKEAEEILTAFGQKMNKRIAIDKIELTFEEPKTFSGGSILFNTALGLVPIAGAKMMSKTKSRSLLEGVRAAIAQIEKQQRRSDRSKADTR